MTALGDPELFLKSSTNSRTIRRAIPRKSPRSAWPASTAQCRGWKDRPRISKPRSGAPTMHGSRDDQRGRAPCSNVRRAGHRNLRVVEALGGAATAIVGFETALKAAAVVQTIAGTRLGGGDQRPRRRRARPHGAFGRWAWHRRAGYIGNQIYKNYGAMNDSRQQLGRARRR